MCSYLAIDKIMLTDPKQKEKEAKWYFTQESLEADTPSRRNGLSYEDEMKFRRAGVRFLYKLTTRVYSSKFSIYKKTNVVVNSSRVLATAATWFHRFFMVHPFQVFDCFETAMACFYLASKAEDYPENIQIIISRSRDILNYWMMPFNASNVEVEEELKDLENCIMKTIGFVVWVRHPHQFIEFFIDQFIIGDKEKLARIQQLAALYATDSLCTPFCVRENPKKLAIAFISWACTDEKYNLNNWKNKVESSKASNWLEVFNLKQHEIDSLYKEYCEQIHLSQVESQEIEARINNNSENFVYN